MIEARFRHRAESGQSIQLRHVHVMDRLAALEGLWHRRPDHEAKLSTAGGSASCHLGPWLLPPLSGALSYSERFPQGTPDRAKWDDTLTFRLDEGEFNYREFAGLTFESVAEAFGAYRAGIVMSFDIDLNDFEAIADEAERTGMDEEGRDSVFRIQPVNYFDEELCRRAFGVDAAGVVSRLSGEVERVELKGGGVLLIVTSDLVDAENLAAINERVSGLLRR